MQDKYVEAFPGSSDLQARLRKQFDEEDEKYVVEQKEATDEEELDFARALFGDDFVDGLHEFDKAQQRVNSILSSSPHE